MKNIIDPTISEILNSSENEELASSKLQNPLPILQQQKSIITTNPYIEPLKEKEIKEITKPKSIKLYEIKKRFSDSCLGFFDDLYKKPDNIHWNKYIFIILKKDERMNYFGVLLIFIVFFFLLIK